jgi:hypothetical protein
MTKKKDGAYCRVGPEAAKITTGSDEFSQRVPTVGILLLLNSNYGYLHRRFIFHEGILYTNLYFN